MVIRKWLQKRYTMVQKKSTVFVKDLRVNPTPLNLSYGDLMQYAPKYLINENKIDTSIWLTILKAGFLKRLDLIKDIIQCAF